MICDLWLMIAIRRYSYRLGSRSVYLPPDVIPDDGACDCSCWACSCAPLDVWTFDAPVFALPVSPTSTQLPPRCLPVFPATHTFPLFGPAFVALALFTPALVPAQAVTRTRISPTKPICSNFVFIVNHPTSSYRKNEAMLPN